MILERLHLYIDEDAMDNDLVAALRFRGIDVITASELRMVERTDEEHLAVATAQGRALYSFNVCDFHRIHAHWVATGRAHAGIILAPQQRYSVGEQMRKLTRLIGSLTAEEMQNREEFLGRW